jgi:signal transduction histidine kinase
MRALLRWVNSLTSIHPSLIVGGLLSAAVGTSLYVLTANTIEKDAWERFNSVVRTSHFSILSRVKSYTDVLRGAASLFQSGPVVTREQFQRYVAGLRLPTEFPDIDTLNYAVSVKDTEKAEFERQMSAEMAALGKTGPFKIAPPGKRPEYLVITFLEPATARGGRLGFDIQAGPRSVAPLFRSRDTGGVSASGKPIPIPYPMTLLGIRLPAYRMGMPTETVAQRRLAYQGSVGVSFNVERLMDGVMAELPVPSMHLTLIGLVDDDKIGKSKRLLLYDSERRRGAPVTKDTGTGDDEFRLTLPIEFSERNWETQYRIKKYALLSAVDIYAPWVALAAGSISTALLYALFHTLATSRRRALGLAEEMTKELRASEANLQQSNLKLRELAAHADNIKEGERKRIAREIHDDLGQNLLALRIEADQLASRTGDRHPRLHVRAQRTLDQIDSTIKSVRQIINDLRPNVLDLGLNAAVDWQIEQFQRRTGIPCKLFENDKDIRVSDRCATALFRILQESLTNVTRHANASRVEVDLLVDGNRLLMSVRDNARGLPTRGGHKPGSFGLVGIEERVKILGGRCSIGRGPQGGTSVSVSVPLTDVALPTEQRDSTAMLKEADGEPAALPLMPTS